MVPLELSVEQLLYCLELRYEGHGPFPTFTPIEIGELEFRKADLGIAGTGFAVNDGRADF